MKKLMSLILVAINVYAAQIIEITEKQQHDLGVKTQKVKEIKSIALSPYNGTVVLDKKDIISISSNIESIVKEIYISDFEHVKKGQKLLTLKSNALLGIQREYIESLMESQSASRDYRRDVKLEASGIISKKRLLSSKKLRNSAFVSLKLNENQLLTNGFTQQSLKKIRRTSRPIVEQDIYAPKDGVVYKIDVSIGEYVQSDKMMIGIYGDGKRYIELSVPVKVVEGVSIGDLCTFSHYGAKIVAIDNVVDVESQSVRVRAEVENHEGIMINRIYGVKIFKEVQDAVKIKKSTLVFVDGDSFVFKKISTGFEVLRVHIISEGAVCYVIKAALHEGDLLAVTSTAALLSAMESEDE
jgi:multidrug efflux pump subunit AcrA (membrane-fusion protein)